jgi:hypothetical protein
VRPDVFFVSSYELGAEQNWARLRRTVPYARRIRGMSSIRAAFAACAEAARTPHFFMVDGDNWLIDGFAFDFDFEPSPQEAAVWRARNPINGLAYGNGAIKLLPTVVTGIGARSAGIDIGTSIAPAYRVVDVIASEHRFNTSAFDAWRTAFRECVKLSANLIRQQDQAAISARLAAWCDDPPGDVAVSDFADYCVAGGREGRAYAVRHVGEPLAMARINDFAWLADAWAARWSATKDAPE